MKALTKSEYMDSIRHPALLWMKRNAPEKLAPVDAATQAIFDAGYEFEELAEELFPERVDISMQADGGYATMPLRTEQAIADGAKVVTQGRFEVDGLSIVADVVEMVGAQALNLYEIKSTSSAKEEHIQDLAYQAHVLRRRGYEVLKISVIHINSDYVLDGELDIGQYAKITDVTERVETLRDFTAEKVPEALAIIDMPEMPDPNPIYASKNYFQEWVNIYRHHKDLPDDSVYNLITLNPAKLKQLQDMGIEHLIHIPEDFQLTPKQLLQVEATKRGEPIVDIEPIREFLGSFEYPIYFLDYETMSKVVPPFQGTRPYQQLPFQYSLHILDAPDAPLRHEEYLHTDNSNPMESVAQALRSHIGDTGTVLAWNMTFEKSCNKALAKAVPELQQFLEDVNTRMKDLDEPFKNLWYVDGRFKGSYSIKYVLPVLVPELSYKSLDIQEGGTAQRVWMETILDGKHEAERDKIISDLIKYCTLDTLAMVEIYNFLRKLVDENTSASQTK